MSKKLSSLIAFAVCVFISSAHGADTKFPHREKYKQVPVMEIEQLRQELDKVIVVDVRSKYEFETLHIKGAVHVPLNAATFPAAAQALRRSSPKPIVFYCNGTACRKSYEAVEFAINAGVSKVYAFDAGLDEWSRKHPELSVLLGKGPAKAEELIDGERFNRRFISAAEFESRMEQGGIVLDIRDLAQRDVMLFPFKERRAPLDDKQKIAEVVAEAKRAGKPLLVYDKVGKQVRWFQYLLEREGVKQYFFLSGGEEGYHAAKLGKPAAKSG